MRGRVRLRARALAATSAGLLARDAVRRQEPISRARARAVRARACGTRARAHHAHTRTHREREGGKEIEKEIEKTGRQGEAARRGRA